MKQIMYTVEIKSPESPESPKSPKSREERRREKAEWLIALFVWVILIAGILAAGAGILHYAGEAGAVIPAHYEPVAPSQSGEISAILTAAEWGGE